MSAKDWILLLVPILCNGVLVFFFQKTFERNQLAFIEKYKYVSIMQQKVDDALALFVKLLQTKDDESMQIDFFNRFISSYCDVYYYYQQNQTLFESLKNKMKEIEKTHKQIQSDQLQLGNTKQGLEAVIRIEPHIYRIYELLQSIQSDCIQHKI